MEKYITKNKGAEEYIFDTVVMYFIEAKQNQFFVDFKI